MQLLWSKPIPCRNPWEPQLQGVFAHHAGEPAFFWLEHGGSMHAMLLTAERGLLRRLPPVAGLSLPRHWRLLEECSLLQLTDSHALDLNTLQLIPHDLPTPRKEAYPSFTLGDYRIDYNAGHKLICTRSGEVAWTFKIQAYLYTPVLPWQDLIFFGTSGNGGHFYILRLATGEVVADVRTGGTVYIAQEDGLCYIIANMPKAHLLQVEIATGRITGDLPLPGKGTDSSLRLMDGQIHAITYQYKSGRLTGAVWNCAGVRP